jgi:D-glycero-alpha-D-manno-heptose-7-phosphate kinase
MDSPIEITSIADIPSGTGLGSSGSFGTALIKALKLFTDQKITTYELAEMACKVEIEVLKEPVGKQDQYIAAFGGIRLISIESTGETEVSSINMPQKIQSNLENSLQLFFTDKTRKASEILKDQDSRSLAGDIAMKDNLDEVFNNSFLIEKALLLGQLEDFAQYMHLHWQHKKERSKGISNDFINELYEFSIKNGASGGKIVGAGGGGFLLTFCKDPEKLSNAMQKKGIREVKFNFENSGTTQVV